MAVKINAKNRHWDKGAAQSELVIFRHISQRTRHYDSWHFVRKLINSFVINVSEDHVCLAFEPLRESLWIYCRRFAGGVIPSGVLKVILRMELDERDLTTFIGMPSDTCWRALHLLVTSP